MQDTEHDEDAQQAGDHISGEDDHEDGVSQQVQRSSGECVQQVSGERTNTEGSNSIARKDKTDHRFIRIELVLQVKRQDRQYQIKCEEQQKVGC